MAAGRSNPQGKTKKEKEGRNALRVAACFLLALAAFLSGVAEGTAGDYRVRRKTADYVVDARIDRNPPVLGINTIRIEIRDPMGRPLAGARVWVNYFMPPMPGMAPMNYTVAAPPSGRGYAAGMNFIMTGPWNIVIRVQSEGATWKVVFPIDVR